MKEELSQMPESRASYHDSRRPGQCLPKVNAATVAKERLKGGQRGFFKQCVTSTIVRTSANLYML